MKSTKIDGLYFLLGTDTRRNEWVSRYSDAEMEEVFNDKERLALNSGLSVRTRDGTIWTNMVGAAHAARERLQPRSY
jgi:hypothetical protein